MTEFILLTVILAQLAFLVWNEMRYEKHIKELEKRPETKVKVITVPAASYQRNTPGVPPKMGKPSTNTILKQTDNEVMLNEIPFMEIPRDFKIEHEGSPESPAEAVARKGE